jgi:hypothetical protein
LLVLDEKVADVATIIFANISQVAFLIEEGHCAERIKSETVDQRSHAVLRSEENEVHAMLPATHLFEEISQPI